LENCEGGDARSIVHLKNGINPTLIHPQGIGNGDGTGVMKEAIDGILGSRFFPYKAPTTPKIPTSAAQRKKDFQDDGGGIHPPPHNKNPIQVFPSITLLRRKALRYNGHGLGKCIRGCVRLLEHDEIEKQREYIMRSCPTPCLWLGGLYICLNV
jgi:hypothetical protein